MSGPVLRLSKPSEVDTHKRRRRVRALLLRAALWNGRETHSAGSIAGTEWEDLPTDRWPGPEAVTFCNEYQLSPTQPVTRRSKAAPIASGQIVHVTSQPPNVSGGTVS